MVLIILSWWIFFGFCLWWDKLWCFVVILLILGMIKWFWIMMFKMWVEFVFKIRGSKFNRVLVWLIKFVVFVIFCGDFILMIGLGWFSYVFVFNILILVVFMVLRYLVICWWLFLLVFWLIWWVWFEMKFKMFWFCVSLVWFCCIFFLLFLRNNFVKIWEGWFLVGIMILLLVYDWFFWEFVFNERDGKCVV